MRRHNSSEWTRYVTPDRTRVCVVIMSPLNFISSHDLFILFESVCEWVNGSAKGSGIAQSQRAYHSAHPTALPVPAACSPRLLCCLQAPEWEPYPQPVTGEYAAARPSSQME